MADIYHDFPIKASPARVYEAIRRFLENGEMGPYWQRLDV